MRKGAKRLNYADRQRIESMKKSGAIPVILKIALLERIAEEWQRTQTDK